MDGTARSAAGRPPRAPQASPLRRLASAPTSGSKLRPPSRGRSPGGVGAASGAMGSEASRRRRSMSFESPGGGGNDALARSSSPQQPQPRLSAAPRGGGGIGGFRQSSVRVAVRCRPMGEEERRRGEPTAVSVSGRTVTLAGGPRAHSYGQRADDEGDPGAQVFAFDHAFGPESDQLEVFAACGAPLVKDLIGGFNATIFAYGQTGSGKSALLPAIAPQCLSCRPPSLLTRRAQSSAAQPTR